MGSNYWFKSEIINPSIEEMKMAKKESDEFHKTAEAFKDTVCNSAKKRSGKLKSNNNIVQAWEKYIKNYQSKRQSNASK